MFIDMKKTDIRKIRTKIITRNLVDKDVQSMLLPLNLMQNITKYCIKDNFIAPIGLIHHFVSLLGTGIFIYAFFHRLYILYSVQTRENSIYTQYVISLFECGYYTLGLATNFFGGISNSKIYISFVLVFQNIHRFLNDRKRSKNITFWNWFSIIMASSFFATIFISCILKLNLPYFYILSCYSLVSFDFNYIYAIRLLKFLEDKVILWKTRAMISQEIEDVDEIKGMLNAYDDILNCYEIYKACFQNIILYYTIEVFIHFLVYFQVALVIIKEGMKHNEFEIAELTTLYVYFWSLKNFMLQVILCQHCEKFYGAVEMVQDCCAIILNSDCTGEQKRMFRNVQRLHRAAFRKIRLCGLFNVDALLVLNLMNLLTNYIVVLLTFAFL